MVSMRNTYESMVLVEQFSPQTLELHMALED